MKNLRNILATIGVGACLALASPFSENGQLRVQGPQLVNQNGEAFNLRGVSTHGLQWMDTCYTRGSVASLAYDWNVNAVRVAVYTEEDGYLSSPAMEQKMDNKIDSIVKWTEEFGLYVILDWHILSNGNPMSVVDPAIAFFSKMSTKYAAKNHVIYETANEPNNFSGTGYDSDFTGAWENTLKPYHELILGVIRANSPNAVAILGTPNWCQNPEVALSSPVAFGNVLYSFHLYAASTGVHSDFAHITNLLNKIPLAVTEIGTSTYTGGGAINLAQTKRWIDMFDGVVSSDNPWGVKVSWTNWSFSDATESSAALLPGSCESEDWTNTTASGAFIRSTLRNELIPVSSSSGAVMSSGIATSSSSVVAQDLTIWKVGDGEVSRLGGYLWGSAGEAANTGASVWGCNGSFYNSANPAPNFHCVNADSGNLAFEFDVSIAGGWGYAAVGVDIQERAATATRPPATDLSAYSGVRVTYTSTCPLDLELTTGADLTESPYYSTLYPVSIPTVEYVSFETFKLHVWQTTRWPFNPALVQQVQFKSPNAGTCSVKIYEIVAYGTTVTPMSSGFATSSMVIQSSSSISSSAASSSSVFFPSYIASNTDLIWLPSDVSTTTFGGFWGGYTYQESYMDSSSYIQCGANLWKLEEPSPDFASCVDTSGMHLTMNTSYGGGSYGGAGPFVMLSTDATTLVSVAMTSGLSLTYKADAPVQVRLKSAADVGNDVYQYTLPATGAKMVTTSILWKLFAQEGWGPRFAFDKTAQYEIDFIFKSEGPHTLDLKCLGYGESCTPYTEPTEPTLVLWNSSNPNFGTKLGGSGYVFSATGSTTDVPYVACGGAVWGPNTMDADPNLCISGYIDFLNGWVYRMDFQAQMKVVVGDTWGTNGVGLTIQQGTLPFDASAYSGISIAYNTNGAEGVRMNVVTSEDLNWDAFGAPLTGKGSRFIAWDELAQMGGADPFTFDVTKITKIEVLKKVEGETMLGLTCIGFGHVCDDAVAPRDSLVPVPSVLVWHFADQVPETRQGEGIYLFSASAAGDAGQFNRCGATVWAGSDPFTNASDCIGPDGVTAQMNVVVSTDSMVSSWGANGMGFNVTSSSDLPFDASAHGGVSIAFNTNNSSYRINVKTSDNISGDYHGTSLYGVGTAYLRWSDLVQEGWGTKLALDPSKITGIEVVSKQNGTHLLGVSCLAFGRECELVSPPKDSLYGDKMVVWSVGQAMESNLGGVMGLWSKSSDSSSLNTVTCGGVSYTGEVPQEHLADCANSDGLKTQMFKQGVTWAIGGLSIDLYADTLTPFDARNYAGVSISFGSMDNECMALRVKTTLDEAFDFYTTNVCPGTNFVPWSNFHQEGWGNSIPLALDKLNGLELVSKKNGVTDFTLTCIGLGNACSQVVAPVYTPSVVYTKSYLPTIPFYQFSAGGIVPADGQFNQCGSSVWTPGMPVYNLDECLQDWSRGFSMKMAVVASGPETSHWGANGFGFDLSVNPQDGLPQITDASDFDGVNVVLNTNDSDEVEVEVFTSNLRDDDAHSFGIHGRGNWFIPWDSLKQTGWGSPVAFDPSQITKIQIVSRTEGTHLVSLSCLAFGSTSPCSYMEAPADSVELQPIPSEIVWLKGDNAVSRIGGGSLLEFAGSGDTTSEGGNVCGPQSWPLSAEANSNGMQHCVADSYLSMTMNVAQSCGETGCWGMSSILFPLSGDSVPYVDGKAHGGFSISYKITGSDLRVLVHTATDLSQDYYYTILPGGSNSQFVSWSSLQQEGWAAPFTFNPAAISMIEVGTKMGGLTNVTISCVALGDSCLTVDAPLESTPTIADGKIWLVGDPAQTRNGGSIYHYNVSDFDSTAGQYTECGDQKWLEGAGIDFQSPCMNSNGLTLFYHMLSVANPVAGLGFALPSGPAGHWDGNEFTGMSISYNSNGATGLELQLKTTDDTGDFDDYRVALPGTKGTAYVNWMMFHQAGWGVPFILNPSNITAIEVVNRTPGTDMLLGISCISFGDSCLNVQPPADSTRDAGPVEVVVAPENVVVSDNHITWIDMANDETAYVVYRRPAEQVWDSTVIDNGWAYYKAYGGAWSKGCAPACFGTDYDYATTNGPSVYALFSTSFKDTVNVEVSLWSARESYLASNVPVQVTDAHGVVHSLTVNLREGEAGWITLGTFDMGPWSSVKILTDGADGYVLSDAVRYRQLVDGAWQSIMSLAANTESFTDTLVSPGERGYVYGVRAVRDTSLSEIVLATRSPVYVNAPMDVGISNNTLVWTDMTEGELGYEIFRREALGGFDTLIVDNGSNLSTAYGAWGEGTEPAFFGSAYAYSLNSDASTFMEFGNEIQGTQNVEVSIWSARAPYLASNVQVEVVDAFGITHAVTVSERTGLSGWISLGSFSMNSTSVVRILATGADGFVLADGVRYIVPLAGAWTKVASVSENATTWTDASVDKNNRNYEYAVQTFSGDDVSTLELATRTPVLVNAPANALITDNQISWVDQNDSEQGYKVFRREIAGAYDSIIVDNNTAGTTTSGSWGEGTEPAFHGTAYQYNNTSDLSTYVTYGTNLNSRKVVEISIWAARASYLASNATVQIIDADGHGHIATANMREGEAGWIVLGTYTMDATSEVRLLTVGADGYVLADGVRYRSAVPGAWTEVASLGENTQGWTDAGVANADRSYEYALQAISGDGASDLVVVNRNLILVDPVASASVEDNRLNWSAPALIGHGYKISRRALIGSYDSVIVDNGSPLATASGAWGTGTYPAFYGSPYNYNMDFDGKSYMEYGTGFLSRKTVEVAIYSGRESYLASNVTVEIVDADGITHTVTANERDGVAGWIVLGTFPMDLSSVVRVLTAGADGFVLADGVRYREAVPGEWVEVATVGNVNSWTDASVSNADRNYEYGITTFSADDVASMFVVTRAPVLVVNPWQVTLEGLQLTWVDKNTYEMGYEVSRRLINATFDTVIVDNSTPLSTAYGSWGEGSYPAFYGTAYNYNVNFDASTYMEYATGFAARKLVEVSIYAGRESYLASNAQVEVVDAEGTTHSLTANMRDGSDGWIVLGTFAMDGSSLVRIKSEGADGYVLADAVRFINGVAGSWTMVETLGANSNSWTAAAGEEGMYEYQVRAFSTDTTSEWVIASAPAAFARRNVQEPKMVTPVVLSTNLGLKLNGRMLELSLPKESGWVLNAMDYRGRLLGNIGRGVGAGKVNLELPQHLNGKVLLVLKQGSMTKTLQVLVK